VLRNRRAAFHPRVSEDMLRATSRDAEHLHLRRALGFASLMVVPLVARGRLLGAITFARGPAGAPYAAADLELAEELALRAGLAVDNARLYQEAQAQADAQTM